MCSWQFVVQIRAVHIVVYNSLDRASSSSLSSSSSLWLLQHIGRSLWPFDDESDYKWLGMKCFEIIFVEK